MCALQVSPIKTNVVTPGGRKRDRLPPSLTRYVRVMALAAAAVLLLTAAVNFIVIRGHLDSVAEQERTASAAVKARILEEQLAGYREMLATLAADTAVADLLLTNDVVRAAEWAEQVRSLLPHSTGAALINNRGEVLGDPVALRLGRLCLADLQRRMDGLRVPDLPVHRGVPGLAHFDLHQPVYDSAGSRIGLVVISFSIERLQQALQRITAAGEHSVVILEERGERVVEAGNEAVHSATDPVSVAIGDTGWAIAIHSEPARLDTVVPWLGLSVVVVAAFTVVMILIFARYVARAFSSEFDRLHNLLLQVHTDQDLDPATTEPRLLETQSINRLVLHMAKQLQQKQRRLMALGLTDELTGLANRRGFQQEFERVFSLALRGMRVAVVVIDLDHFKQLNDSRGHAQGDRVLTIFAAALRRQARRSDVVSRWGGDEFVVALLDTSADQVQVWLERLSEAFRTQQVHLFDTRDHNICTLSCGFSFVDKDRDKHPEQTLERADQALYRAKERGRDCVAQVPEPD